MLVRQVGRSLSILSFLVILAGFAAAQSAPKSLHDITEAVDKHYNSLKTLEANFEESYQGGGLSRNESGVMWMKKPGKMLWQYSSPRQKIFVTDGKAAWFYVPGEHRASKAAVKNLDDFRSPLRYMLGRTKLEKEFTGLAIAAGEAPKEGAGNVVLRGIPKGMEDRVSQVLLEITPDSRIARLFIEELDGSRTDFRFRQQKEDVQIADARFKFVPPAGVEVMEAKELEP